MTVNEQALEDHAKSLMRSTHQVAATLHGREGGLLARPLFGVQKF
jgi:hypothetical protein